MLGMSSSQLTNSIIFQRGWNHQPEDVESYESWKMKDNYWGRTCRLMKGGKINHPSHCPIHNKHHPTYKGIPNQKAHISGTLWWTNIAMENHHAINGKIHYKWPFSIAFCMLTRGYGLSLGSPHQTLWCDRGSWNWQAECGREWSSFAVTPHEQLCKW